MQQFPSPWHDISLVAGQNESTNWIKCTEFKLETRELEPGIMFTLMFEIAMKLLLENMQTMDNVRLPYLFL